MISKGPQTVGRHSIASWRVLLAMLPLGLLLSSSASVRAQTTFTDQADFLASSRSSEPITEGWDSWPALTLLPNETTFCRAVFSFTIEDGQGQMLDLQVFDFYDTSTPQNYLGPESSEPRFGSFLPGDSATFIFDPPLLSFGATIVASRSTFEGLFHLTARLASGAQITVDSTAPSATLADESEVYFVGIFAPGDPIAMATVESDLDLYVFNLDEVILRHQFLIGPGDVNLDGVLDLLDVPAFVAILLEFPDACDLETVDLNGDGKVDDPVAAARNGMPCRTRTGLASSP